jgi:Gram-negative bacterial TonB protein C-terminal
MLREIELGTPVQTDLSENAMRFRFCLIVCVFCMVSCSNGSVSSPAEGPVVPLSFRPIKILSANGALWVAGTDESIATSQDGGRTWELKHNNKDGEVLVDLGWLNAKTGYASGTRGLFLWTTDGGITWTPRVGATGTTFQVSFGDEKRGIRKTDSTAEFTADGGAHWNEIPALKLAKPIEGDQQILDVVALDSNRMAVSLQRGGYAKHDNVLISTNDGGKRGATVEMPLMQFTLIAKDSEYWAAGRKNPGHVVGKDGTEKKVEFPLVMDSRDGEIWTNRPRISVDLGPCNTQGCLLWDGVWSDPVTGMPPYWVFPPRSTWGSTTYEWAVAAGRMCTLEADLICTDSISSGLVPPKSKPASGATINVIGPPFGLQPLRNRCLSCPEPVLIDPDQPGVWGGSGTLVRFVIRKNGTVDQVRMTNWFGSKFKAPLTNAIQKWVFQPVLDKDGAAVDQEEHVMVDFILVRPPGRN